MRLIAAALVLSTACGGTVSPRTSSSCSATAGTFTFTAADRFVDPYGDALCGALPASFSVTVSVASGAATGTENGQAFSADPDFNGFLVWEEPTSPATRHYYCIIPGHSSLTIAKVGRCAAMYTLAQSR